uniref:glutamate dehydrogenase (NADP(+)) n=1 Tax=Wollemia nobilis TaxID=56998 RepID=A0A0C9RUV5_9CONI
MNSPMDDMNLLRQRHHLIVREMGEEIDLEMGAGDDDPTFAQATPALVASLAPQDHGEDHKQLLMAAQEHHHLHAQQNQQQQQQAGGMQAGQQPRKKKKVVKKWRDEWADTYKWAYVDVYEGTTRIFCSVCKEYGRKHRRNPYGNEGSRNMQMSALEEHNNSLLHKEALRLQAASKDKSISSLDRPIYVKALLCKSAESIVEAVMRKDPHEVEFIQAVQEIVHSLEPVLSKTPQYVHVLERLLEPERVIIFRVPWVDDKGETHINRGFRVQFSQALGPCRGGLRYHPSTTLSVAKFLGLEQTLKNALSRYRFGGAAGGSDFDPKGKSDNEIMRFCQSFMEELYRHLGPSQDLPAEDMGVGPREMNYLFGQYRRLAGQFQGNFIGPRNCWTGSALRTEATGYGLVYFAQMILLHMDRQLKGLRCVVSGAGKIAMHVLEKLLAFGAVPITISDSRGYLLDEEGFDIVKLELLKQIKMQQRSLREYVKTYPRAKYFDELKPWSEQCDIAFPCATQNELNHADALNLVNSGCRILIEGSNMPCTAEAVYVLRKYKVLVGPAKAATAGGVGVAELEAFQDGNLIHCSPEEIVQESIKHIYDLSVKTAIEYGFLKENPELLVHGGNIAAFLNIARAMIDQGCV